MSLPFLQNIGLSQKEADLYELLLGLGEVPTRKIIRESKLKRATAYKILYSLKKKGLITQKDIAKKIHFCPEPPTNLLSLAEDRFEDLERAKDELASYLPHLRSQYVKSVEKPIIRIFEGVDGMKKAHMEVLEEKKEILAYVRINEDIDKDLASFWPRYYSIRKKNDIFARVITPDTKGARKYYKNDKKQLRETRLLPEDQFPINLEKDIVGNKIAFFTISEDKKLIATIVENQTIAEAERAIFELAWQKAGEFNKEKGK